MDADYEMMLEAAVDAAPGVNFERSDSVMMSSESSVEFTESPRRVSFPETWLWSDVVAGYGSHCMWQLW